jgi:phage terminase Nu1 subunit (DNA packaging protein)
VGKIFVGLVYKSEKCDIGKERLMAAQSKPDIVVDESAAYVIRSEKPIYVKTADIAAMTGKSIQWIGKLVKQGVLNKSSTPHGLMFDLIPTMNAYCSMVDERTDEDKTSLAKELTKVDLAMKKAKATKAVLETQELIGKMHRADDVALMVSDWFAAIRGMLIALPGRLAVDVAQITDPAEASNRIRSEVFLIMQEMMNHQYDKKKYEGLVRERLSWDKIDVGDGGADDS